MSSGAVDDLISLFESQLNASLSVEGAQAILKWLSTFNESETESNLLRFLEVLDEVLAEDGQGDGDTITYEAIQTAFDLLATAAYVSEEGDSQESLVQHQSLQLPDLTKPTQPSSDTDQPTLLQQQLIQFARELDQQTHFIDVSYYVGERGYNLPFFDSGNQRWSRRPHKPSIIANVDAQANMYLQRFFLVLERVKLLPNVKWWTQRSQASSYQDEEVTLRSVEQARGISGKQYIIGILRTNEELNMADGSSESIWLIEDASTYIRLELTQYTPNDEFILNGNVVIVYGEIKGELLYTEKIIIPWGDHPNSKPCPLTSYMATLRSATEQTLLEKMEDTLKQLMESEDVAHTQAQPWIILNEVLLDDAQVMHRLRRLLVAIEEGGLSHDGIALDENSNINPSSAPLYPKGIILMGNFCKSISPSWSDMSRLEHFMLPTSSCWTINRYSKIETYARVWSALFELLKTVPKLLNSGCHICIVPGPFDPGLSIVPRPAMAQELTSYLADEIRAICPNSQIHLAGNPLRVTQCYRSLVVLRANIYPLLIDKSHALNLPTFVTKKILPPLPQLKRAITKLLFSQSHIYPVPSSFPARDISVMTEFDPLLWLSPRPQLILIGDTTCESWQHRVVGRNLSNHWVVSLGTFGGAKGAWCQYDLAANTLSLHSADALD